jgi:Transposase, Mutator family
MPELSRRGRDSRSAFLAETWHPAPHEAEKLLGTAPPGSTVRDMAELNEQWSKLAARDDHKNFARDLEPLIVSGSTRWEIFRVEGLKAAIAKVLSATWQRCRVHFMRNALAHAGKSGRRVVSAFVATAFAQNDAIRASSAPDTFGAGRPPEPP